jgi:hypothetical protein
LHAPSREASRRRDEFKTASPITANVNNAIGQSSGMISEAPLPLSQVTMLPSSGVLLS